MIELSVIRDLVAIASFIIALTYYILNIQNQRESRKTQMFMPIYSRIIDSEYRRFVSDIRVWVWSDYDDWEKKYYYDRDEWQKLVTVFSVLSMVGTLVKRRQIDLGLVNDTIRMEVVRLWKDLAPMIKEFRLRWSFPSFGFEVEQLYNESMKYIHIEPHNR